MSVEAQVKAALLKRGLVPYEVAVLHPNECLFASIADALCFRDPALRVTSKDIREASGLFLAGQVVFFPPVCYWNP